MVDFVPYKGCDGNSLIPLWTLRPKIENYNAKGSAIHRFFDSSPFSPSNRFIAITIISLPENRNINPGENAEIVVLDLQNRSISYRAITSAWDTQVGAHVQWGATDNELFYNAFLFRNQTSSFRRPLLLTGVKVNIFTGSMTEYELPFYHIDSTGTYAITPDLTKIKYTQLGYGVYTNESKMNLNASYTDGVFFTNLRSKNSTLLVSLHKLAMIAGLDTITTPAYAFHTKWSSDGKYIAIVMRTMHSGASNPSKIFTGKRLRVQHLFVCSRSGGDVRYLTSWHSYRSIYNQKSTNFSQNKNYKLIRCKTDFNPDLDLLLKMLHIRYVNHMNFNSTNYDGGELLPCYQIQHAQFVYSSSHSISTQTSQYSRDGNHPSWIPHTHRISMNMQSYPFLSHKTLDTHRNLETNHKKSYNITVFDMDIIPMIQKFRKNLEIKYFGHSTIPPFQEWPFMIRTHYLFATAFSTVSSNRAKNSNFGRPPLTLFYHSRSRILEYIVFPTGSGHPSFTSKTGVLRNVPSSQQKPRVRNQQSSSKKIRSHESKNLARYALVDAYIKEKNLFIGDNDTYQHSGLGRQHIYTQLMEEAVELTHSRPHLISNSINLSIEHSNEQTIGSSSTPRLFCNPNPNHCLPLRLIDTWRQQAIIIAQVQLQRNSDFDQSIQWLRCEHASNESSRNIARHYCWVALIAVACETMRVIKEIWEFFYEIMSFQLSNIDRLTWTGRRAHWRCDMHPAFSRDGRWMAINARTDGHQRHVVIGYLGDDYELLFDEH